VIQSQGESKASHLVRNNQDPHWNFQAEFFVIDVEGTVEVTIYDKSHSPGTEDEDKAAVTFVGAASLSVSEIIGQLASVQCQNLTNTSLQGIRDEWFKLDLRHSAQGKGPGAKDLAEPALVRLHLQWTKWIEENKEGNGKTSVCGMRHVLSLS
jgi:hypothetical protein